MEVRKHLHAGRGYDVHANHALSCREYPAGYPQWIGNEVGPWGENKAMAEASIGGSS